MKYESILPNTAESLVPLKVTPKDFTRALAILNRAERFPFGIWPMYSICGF
jgi:hypothetical protein